MTASELLAIISLALLVQLTIGIVAAAIRYRKGINARSGGPTGSASTIGTGAWSGLRTFRVTARTPEDRDGSQCSFYLEPVDAMPLPSFKPGQFLTFGLQVGSTQAAGPRALSRCYSLSDSPQERQYRVTIKRVAAPENVPNCAPGASSNYFHDMVQVGSLLQVRAPSGHFFLDTESDTPVVLIGGGIGITPMMSMLQWCLAHQPTRQVHLF